jgi:hypothetical protein
MTTIPDPVTRVLDLADPEDVDQPAPPKGVRPWSGEIVPVTEPCECCGCHWICNPDAFLPEGHAECCFCRTWRGSIHRDARLSEFSTSSGESTTGNETIEVVNANALPVYDPVAMGLDDEDAVGVIDLLQSGDGA